MPLLAFVAAASAAEALAARADDKPTVIVVVGVDGTPEYGATFAKSADAWADAAKRGGANLVVIGRDKIDSTKDVTDETLDIDKSKLHNAVLEALKEKSAPLWLVFLGHGTFDGKEAKFNLRGADVSDQELTNWFKPNTRPLAFIDCSSSSAPFLNKMSGRGRVVITATRTGQELNYARFGEYFAAAIGSPAADIDKDGETSLLEAFLAASHGVAEFYKGEGRIMTEHALLDDNGDALGITADWFQGVRATEKAKDGKPVDGPRAHQWALIRSPAEAALPAEVRAQRDEIELKLEALRGIKTTLDEDEYYTELDGLLVGLAKIYQQESAAGPTTAPK